MRLGLLFYLFCFFLGHSTSAQTHSYFFNGNLDEASGTGPILQRLVSCGATSAGDFANQPITIRHGGSTGVDASCGTTDQSVFAFNRGGGLSYPNDNVISGNYTIHLFFKFSAYTYSYQRVIDFSNSTLDRGIYITSSGGFGRLNFYPSGSVGPNSYFVANRFYLITLVRDAATRRIVTYVNGESFANYLDEHSYYVPATSTTPIVFFRDNDGSSSCEIQSGSIKYFSIKPTTSTAEEVANTWSSICSIVLPLKLLSFTAQKQDQYSLLKWTTAEEENTSHVQVERSADGKTFEAIGNVATTNISGENHYQFTDKQPLQGVNIYRLKVIDLDGSYKYSSIASVSHGASAGVSVFPNPAKDKIVVRGVGMNSMVKLLNTDGKLLTAQKATGNDLHLDISHLPAGLYVIQYSNGNEWLQQKILKQ